MMLHSGNVLGAPCWFQDSEKESFAHVEKCVCQRRNWSAQTA